MKFDEFWTRGNLKERIKIAFEKSNLNKKSISIEDLHPIDQYHARGIAATKELAEKLSIKNNHKIIDVGCGLGGPARFFAKKSVKLRLFSYKLCKQTSTIFCHL